MPRPTVTPHKRRDMSSNFVCWAATRSWSVASGARSASCNAWGRGQPARACRRPRHTYTPSHTRTRKAKRGNAAAKSHTRPRQTQNRTYIHSNRHRGTQQTANLLKPLVPPKPQSRESLHGGKAVHVVKAVMQAFCTPTQNKRHFFAGKPKATWNRHKGCRLWTYLGEQMRQKQRQRCCHTCGRSPHDQLDGRQQGANLRMGSCGSAAPHPAAATLRRTAA
jgi:hypothetical protein